MQPSIKDNLMSVKTISTWTSSELLKYLETLEQPLILKGLVNDWPIVAAANRSDIDVKDYLLQLSQPMQVGVGKIPAEENGRLFYNPDFTSFNFERSNCLFSTFLTQLFSEKEQKEPSGYYLGSTHINNLMPDFNQYNDIKELNDKNALSSIWISNKTHVAAHQDFPNNVACCVAGKRRFTLFPPDQIENLYIGPLDHTPAGQPISLVDLNKPDFNKYPKFQQALKSAQVAELEPGDALLLPSLWWHAVDSLAPLNVLVNYWWQNTQSYMGSPNDALHHALLNISNLPAHQKKAVQDMFNYYIFNSDENALAHIPENMLGILEKDSTLAARKIRSLLINKLNR